LKIAQASLRKTPRSVFSVENSVNHVGHLLLRPLLTTLKTVTGRMGSTAEKVPCDKAPAWWASVDNAGPRTFYNTIGLSQSSPK
jgi:hypothetical protein